MKFSKRKDLKTNPKSGSLSHEPLGVATSNSIKLHIESTSLTSFLNPVRGENCNGIVRDMSSSYFSVPHFNVFSRFGLLRLLNCWLLHRLVEIGYIVKQRLYGFKNIIFFKRAHNRH